MIETILEVLEIIKPVQLVELVRKIRSAKMGAHLLLITIYLQDAIEMSELLLDYLKDFIEQNKDKSEGDNLFLKVEFASRLQEQSYTLEKLDVLLRNFAFEMKALDPNSFKHLSKFVGGKAGLFSEISYHLGEAEFPLPWDRRKGLDAAIRFNEDKPIPDGRKLILQTKLDGKDIDLYVIDYNNIRECLLQLSIYLDKEKPHEKIGHMRTLVDKLFQEIGKHFSLADIIPYLRKIRRHYEILPMPQLGGGE